MVVIFDWSRIYEVDECETETNYVFFFLCQFLFFSLVYLLGFEFEFEFRIG